MAHDKAIVRTHREKIDGVTRTSNMKRSLFFLAVATVCSVAQPAIAQTVDEKCRTKLRLALEYLHGDATRRATITKDDGFDTPNAKIAMYEHALKALDDPDYKLAKPHWDFTAVVVGAMHDPSCKGYATKTLSALIRD